MGIVELDRDSNNSFDCKGEGCSPRLSTYKGKAQLPVLGPPWQAVQLSLLKQRGTAIG